MSTPAGSDAKKLEFSDIPDFDKSPKAAYDFLIRLYDQATFRGDGYKDRYYETYDKSKKIQYQNEKLTNENAVIRQRNSVLVEEINKLRAELEASAVQNHNLSGEILRLNESIRTVADSSSEEEEDDNMAPPDQP